MSGDDDDDWGDDLGGDDGTNLVSKIVHKQVEMRKSASLEQETVKVVHISPHKSPAPSDRSIDPLLHQFDNLTSSISSSVVTVESLRDQLADCYMDTILKKTVLDQQSIVLQSIQIQDKLQQLKLKGQQKRATLAKLRYEYDHRLQNRISDSSRQPSPQGFHVQYTTINYYLSLALLVLPLIAAFMMARIIRSDLI